MVGIGNDIGPGDANRVSVSLTPGVKEGGWLDRDECRSRWHRYQTMVLSRTFNRDGNFGRTNLRDHITSGMLNL